MWTAHIHKRTGYGRFYLDGKVVEAHRAAYLLLVGPVPEGLELDHLCRNRACVRPSHMEPVTPAENLRRSPLMGMNTRERMALKTHCPKGHPYSGDNLRITPTGARRCVTCRRASGRASEARRRADASTG